MSTWVIWLPAPSARTAAHGARKYPEPLVFIAVWNKLWPRRWPRWRAHCWSASIGGNRRVFGVYRNELSPTKGLDFFSSPKVEDGP